MKIAGLLLSIFSLVLVSCSEAPTPAPRVEKEEVDKNNEDSTDLAKLSAIELRPNVSAFMLDSAQFRLNGLVVGKQTFMDSEVPVISFFRPSRADYVEILRCRASAVIEGGGDYVDEADLGSATIEEETAIRNAGSFWKAGLEAGCKLIGENIADEETFLDWSAPTGSFKYLARACVDPSRLTETEFLSNKVCSNQVMSSNKLNGYVDKREAKVVKALAEAELERAKISGIGRTIYYETVAMNNALTTCQKKEKKRLIKAKRKAAITSLVGMGVSLGGSIATMTMTGATSAKEIFAGMWKERNKIAGAGMSIAGMLNNITAGFDDYTLTCTKADEHRQTVLSYKVQLKRAHEEFAIKVDIASGYEGEKEELEE